MLIDRAMAQAISRRPLIAEVRVRARVSSCWIVVDKLALGQVSLRVYWFCSVNIIPP
jgi:hypothetical protein